MATFKEFAAEDIKSAKSFLNQLVDVLGNDISGSSTRKQYQVFVTGGVGPGVTSSLFQTVFDQDFTLQTANSIFDITYGFHTGSEVVTGLNPTIDANGKYIFPNTSLMMREKLDIYRLFAQQLLGSEDEIFTTASGSTSYQIKEPLFIAFKRLFARDQIKRETFAIRFAPTGAVTTLGGKNIALIGSGSSILTDINSSTNKFFAYGGQVSTVVDSANVGNPLGLLFLDKGILVLDMSRSFDQARLITGSIDSAAVSTGTAPNLSGTLMVLAASASIDDFLDHLCSTRFTASAQTAVTFQNVTNINSTLYFCRLAADEANYSSNPTYVDSNNRIVVIDQGQEETQRSFTFITSIGLYDAYDNLLGVAKVSRPVLKDDERDLTLKVRLDY
ncbi:MAG: hypothetical protein WC761_00710 [Candidatus Paceibacterota bacterium]|jgi:hypothetical protein